MTELFDLYNNQLSSGSLQTMANAMLDTEFKSSHPDLTQWMEQERQDGAYDNDSKETEITNNIGSSSSRIINDDVGNDNNKNNNNSISSRRHEEQAVTLLHPATRTPNGNSSSHSKRHDMRSVVIQVPPKRRKLDPSLTARRLANDISTCAGIGERLAVLQRAKDFLDHTHVSGHDDEVTQGIDVALAKHLVFLVFKISRCRCMNPSSSSNNNNWQSSSSQQQQVNVVQDETLPTLLDEVCSGLEALELLYRASDNAVGESFFKIGPDLLHVLVTLIDEELNRRVLPETQNQTIEFDNDESSNFKQIKLQQQQQEEEEGGRTEANNDNNNESNNSNQDNAVVVEEQQQCDTDKAKEEQETGDDGRGADDDDDDIKDDDSTPELQRPITPLYIKMGSPEGNFLIQKAIKVMGNLARVGKATKPMAFFPGLLGCLLNLVNYQPYDSIPWEARLSALWILGNLACNPDNMQIMMCTPGLVRSLVRVGCRALHTDDPMEVTMEVLRSRSLSSRALLNLSWKPENKIPLSENYALVELLTQLSVHRKAPALNNSRTVRDILTQTRRHAVGALRNLAAAPRRTKIQLCEYKNGHVLDALTDVALNDPDQGIQTRAFAAIHNLAVHDTAERMVERPALVLALKDVLLEDDNNGNNNNTPILKEGSPRSHASATLLVLERTITPAMDSYENLRDLLDAVNPTVPSEDDDDLNDRIVAI